MQAGLLRHRVILQKPNPQSPRDTKGQRIDRYLDMATVSARVRPLSGREQFLAAQRAASTTHEITVRGSPVTAAMDASWRVKWGTRVFVLDAPPRMIEERNIQVILTCVEGKRLDG